MAERKYKWSTSDEKRHELFEYKEINKNAVCDAHDVSLLVDNVENLDEDDVTEKNIVALHKKEQCCQSIGAFISNLCCCSITVPDDYHADIAEFGRYKRTLGPGCYWLNVMTEHAHLVSDVLIKENHRGVLTRNGRFIKVYPPGQYHCIALLGEEIESVKMKLIKENQKGILTRCGVFVSPLLEPGEHFVNQLLEEVLLPQAETFIGSEQVGALLINGVFQKCVPPGKYFANSVLREEIVPIEIVKVAEGEVGLFTREGRFLEFLHPGGYFPIPYKHELIHSVNMQSTTDELKPQRIMSKDTTPFEITSVLVYKAVDAYRAHYAVSKLDYSLREATKTSTQQVLGEFDFDAIMEKKAELSVKIKDRVAFICTSWGVTIERIDIRDITADKELLDDLSAASKAKRQAEARKINAEAEIEIAGKMQLVSKLMSSKAAMQLRALSDLKSMCENPNVKVLLIPPMNSFFSTSDNESDTPNANAGSANSTSTHLMERIVAEEIKQLNK